MKPPRSNLCTVKAILEDLTWNPEISKLALHKVPKIDVSKSQNAPKSSSYSSSSEVFQNVPNPFKTSHLASPMVFEPHFFHPLFRPSGASPRHVQVRPDGFGENLHHAGRSSMQRRPRRVDAPHSIGVAGACATTFGSYTTEEPVEGDLVVVICDD